MGKGTGWRVIFEGNLFEGQRKALVKKRIAALFNMDPPGVENLFENSPFILKSDLDYPSALKYQGAFQKTGAKCRIVPVEKPPHSSTLPDQAVAPPSEKLKAEKSDLPPLNQQINQSFQVDFPHLPFPLSRKIGFLFADLGLVLWLLFYLALIAFLGYGAYTLALSNLQVMLDTWIASIFGILLFLVAIIIFTAVLFFLVKPLWPYRLKKGRAVAINPFKEQCLFNFVQQLCSILRAPMPRHIEIGCEPNVTVCFHSGLAGYLGGELLLILGMPVLAGLNLNQLTGLLGHALRHFSEGASMRLTALARGVDTLFADGASQIDSIDAWLATGARSDNVGLQVLAPIALFFSLLGRKLAWAGLMGCRLISGYLLQQAEYDADHCQAVLAGAQAFEETRLRFNTLALVTNQTLQKAGQDWKERTLADDLYRLILQNVENLTPAASDQLRRDLNHAETGFLASAPPEKNRIDRINAGNASGLINLPGTARELFTDFPVLSRQVTLHYYRVHMHLPVTEKSLLPVSSVVKHQATSQISQTSLKKYLVGIFHSLQPLPLKTRPELLEQPVKERIGQILKHAAYIQKCSANARQTMRDFQALEEKRLTIVQANVLLQAEQEIDPGAFYLSESTLQAAQQAMHKISADRTAQDSQISKLMALLANRMELTFSLLEEPKIMKHLAHAEDFKKESLLLLKVYPEFASTFPLLNELRSACAALIALFENLQDNRGNEPFLSVFLQKQTECKSSVIALFNRLKNIDYPLEGDDKKMSIADLIFENDPEKIDETELPSFSQSTIDQVLFFHTQLMGRLSALADAVEKVIDRIIKSQPPKHFAEPQPVGDPMPPVS